VAGGSDLRDPGGGHPVLRRAEREAAEFRWISVGAGVAILAWILASVLFGFYVGNFGSYNKTYGALAGVIVFLLWLWITNLALLFGAELDAELERGRQLQAGIAAERDLQLPPRDSRVTKRFPATGIEFAPARVAGTQRLATVCRERSVPFGKYWRSSP
jgi:hypothetical protein